MRLAELCIKDILHIGIELCLACRVGVLGCDTFPCGRVITWIICPIPYIAVQTCGKEAEETIRLEPLLLLMAECLVPVAREHIGTEFIEQFTKI